MKDTLWPNEAFVPRGSKGLEGHQRGGAEATASRAGRPGTTHGRVSRCPEAKQKTEAVAEVPPQAKKRARDGKEAREANKGHCDTRGPPAFSQNAHRSGSKRLGTDRV